MISRGFEKDLGKSQGTGNDLTVLAADVGHLAKRLDLGRKAYHLRVNQRDVVAKPLQIVRNMRRPELSFHAGEYRFKRRPQPANPLGKGA